MSFYTNPLTDYSPQMEAGGPVEADRWETDPASSRQGAETVFSEDEELEIASEFLDVGGERDLDRVIGELFDRAGEAGGATLEEPVERDLGDIFKSIAKVVLPVAGGALGMYFGGPAGAAAGSSMGSTVGHALGLELEGLSPEDSEFEAAKQFARLAGVAIRNAQDAGPAADPAGLASDAVTEAARLYAPGLLDVHGRLSLQTVPTGRPGQPLFSSGQNGEADMNYYHRSDSGSSQTSAERPNGQGGGFALSEDEQMDLASQLMELESEAEFEGWMDGVMSTLSKGVQAVGDFVNSPIGQQVKQAVKQALPAITGVVGDKVGGPWGTLIKTGGQFLSDQMEAEAEAEERDWEKANVCVRVIVDAIDHAAHAPHHAHPYEAAHRAVAEALRRHAPHALRACGHAGPQERRRERKSGSWVRHGRHVVVYGL